jgi:hypothetical protein
VPLVLVVFAVLQPGYRWPDNYENTNRSAFYWFVDQVCVGFGGYTGDTRTMGALTTLVIFVGLGTALVVATVLAPGTGLNTRLAGYAGATSAALCLLLQGIFHAPRYGSDYYPPHPAIGLWLLYLATALTLATVVTRDVRTRGAQTRAEAARGDAGQLQETGTGR